MFAPRSFAVIVGAMIDRMMARVLGALALASPPLLAACGDRDPSSAAMQQGAGAAQLEGDERDLTEAIPNDATAEQIVALKAKKYAAGFVADGPPIVGSVVEGGRSDHLMVLRAGHCYRIVAAGGAAVQDMDLFLYDPEGVQTQQDPAEDRYPVLGLQAEICPPEGGAYRLQVHMYKGGGPFAARLYRTP